MADAKDTIYIDIDDEITGIIDKVHGSKGKIVALVLPKRAATFQSIVNMKLLKRAADDAKKHLVLITSEAGLLPLAGAAGVHVAKTLNSKPEIPTEPKIEDDTEEAIEEETGDEPEITTETAGDEPVGKLAGLGSTALGADGVETVELDDDVLPEEASDAAKPKASKPKGKKDKKLHIPNFERFRLWLILGGLVLILLIFGLIFAFVALPKATINIKTDASNVNANLNLNLSTTATSLDDNNNTVPAKLAQQQKTYTQQVATTGQKNNGNKASGSVTVTNCSKSSDITVAAGTGLSSGGNTYISQQTVTVPASDINKGNCQHNGKADVGVIAQNAGSGYNLPSGASFSIANGSSDLSAQGGTISGGTDNIVQIVNQNDINNAKSKINTNDPTIKQALQSQLQQDKYYAIAATFTTGTPTVTNSANVGDAANSVTVTEAVTYSMFGARQDDLKTLIDNQVKSQIDTSKQSILSEGLDTATFNINSSNATSAQLALSTAATVGPDLNIDGIKKDAAGKKPGAIKQQLQTNPDVTSIDVKLSPFWVSSVPKKTTRITVNIAKPTKTAKASNNGDTNP